MVLQCDVAIIGGGPGGYVAAARASALGLKTLVIEKSTYLGGTCLHSGCIPTKTLLHVADLIDNIKHSRKIGLNIPDLSLDFAKIVQYKEKIIKTNAAGVSHLMKAKNIEVINGFGSIIDKNTISVKQDSKEIQINANNILLAVGSKPRELPFAKFDGKRIISSDDVLNFTKIPDSISIIGGGVIGVEFASLFSRLGVKVHLLEALPRILMTADKDVSKELHKALQSDDVNIETDIKISSIKSLKNNSLITYTNSLGNKVELKSEYTLVAIGRQPMTDNIGLENCPKIQLEKGYIAANGFMQTGVDNIYAIGDCVNTHMLAHVASYEGVVAADHIAKKDIEPINYNNVPSGVYTQPEIAWAGLTEEAAKQQNLPVKISRFDFARNAKAAILDKKRGFIKFITDEKYGEILGVHIVGPHATDLIAEPVFAMQMEATIDDIAGTMHAHPTLYEGIYEAAAIACGRAIHG